MKKTISSLVDEVRHIALGICGTMNLLGEVVKRGFLSVPVHIIFFRIQWIGEGLVLMVGIELQALKQAKN